MTNFADRAIWTGDNLDILRGLNSASVDLIYLDPPFNSNRNYAAPVGSAAAGAAFKDTWTLSSTLVDAGHDARVSVRSDQCGGKGVRLLLGAAQTCRLAHPVPVDAPFSPTPQIGLFAGQIQHTSTWWPGCASWE